MAAAPDGVYRQWQILGKPVGSRCLAALLGMGYNRLHGAFHGKVDMRYRRFGFVTWFLAGERKKVHFARKNFSAFLYIFYPRHADALPSRG